MLFSRAHHNNFATVDCFPLKFVLIDCAALLIHWYFRSEWINVAFYSLWRSSCLQTSIVWS